jgi:hypothetical protein
VELDAPHAPTPHPLTIVLGAAVALVGGPGPGLLSVVHLASLATMGAALWWLTDELFGRRAAWVSSALLAMSPWFVIAAATGLQDPIYVSLLLVACRTEVRRPGAGVPVLGLLALAGLLRPEAWGLAAIYCLYLGVCRGERRLRCVALAAAAPVLWLGALWAATGDPLASFHATRELRVLIGRESGLVAGAAAIPALLREVTGGVLALAGLAGALVGLRSGDRRTRTLVVALVLLVLLFLAQAAAGFSVIQRYLLAVDAGLLALAAALLSGHWSIGVAARPAIVGLQLVLWLAVAGTLDDRRTDHAHARAVVADMAASWRDLGAVLPGRAGVCGPLNFAGPADWRSIVALRTGLPLREVRLASVQPAVRGAHLVPVDPDLWALARQAGSPARPLELPAGARVVGRTAVWELSTTCAAPRT